MNIKVISIFKQFIFLTLIAATSAFAEFDPPPPWHLVDVWYQLERDIELESLSIDVEIIGDVARDVSLYIAPFGLGKINEIDFYGGIQNFNDIIVPATQEKLSITRMGLFSRWNERDLRFARVEPDGWSESSDHEDDFIGVRAPYKWKSGKYRFLLRVVESGKRNSWVEMSIRSYQDGVTKRIGALAFPGARPKLSRDFCSFVEIFGDHIAEADYPRVTIVFSNFQINGAPWKSETVTAIYPNDVPQIAHVSGNAKKVIVRLGSEEKGRKNAQVDLQR